jgi:hypothetical protein
MNEAAPPAFVARLERLEAESAVRRLLAEYMALCDTLGPDTPMARLGALFCRDAVWEGRGARYAEALGRHVGRAAIVAMLGRYRDPPHFRFNAHYLASEAIAVAGARATGRWMMLQCSTYADGASDLRSAALELEFAIEDDAWRIARFATTNLFSRPVSRWDDPARIPVPPVQGGDHD